MLTRENIDRINALLFQLYRLLWCLTEEPHNTLLCWRWLPFCSRCGLLSAIGRLLGRYTCAQVSATKRTPSISKRCTCFGLSQLRWRRWWRRQFWLWFWLVVSLFTLLRHCHPHKQAHQHQQCTFLTTSQAHTQVTTFVHYFLDHFLGSLTWRARRRWCSNRNRLAQRHGRIMVLFGLGRGKHGRRGRRGCSVRVLWCAFGGRVGSLGGGMDLLLWGRVRCLVFLLIVCMSKTPRLAH